VAWPGVAAYVNVILAGGSVNFPACWGVTTKDCAMPA
jgi:hypothetical protein